MMSNVVISNRSIFNQRINSIENNKVPLPFNVTKTQIDKLNGLLNKAKMVFSAEPDKLSINTLEFNGLIVKNKRDINSSNISISKTYVATLKRNFIEKVQQFYDRVVGLPPRPMFSIEHETNLQEALAEATAEIDLSALNANMSVDKPMPEQTLQEQPSQVLANDPLGETIINNPITVNNVKEQPVSVDQNTVPEVNTNSVVQQLVPMEQMPTNTVETTQEQTLEGKKLTRKKGNILVIPVVVIWLALVLFGTIKLVTNILT